MIERCPGRRLEPYSASNCDDCCLQTRGEQGRSQPRYIWSDNADRRVGRLRPDAQRRRHGRGAPDSGRRARGGVSDGDARGRLGAGKGGGDFLVGGSGADTFAYQAIADSTPGAQDIVNNFDPAKSDLIDLTVLDQASGVTGRFVTAFDGHAGEDELVQPTAASSYWHVLGDLTGAGSADFEIAFNVAGAATDYQNVMAHIHL